MALVASNAGVELNPIPATVIDKGVLASVPYLSFQGGGLEFNVYGDPDAPVGIELGVARAVRQDPPPGLSDRDRTKFVQDESERIEQLKRKIASCLRPLIAISEDGAVLEDLSVEPTSEVALYLKANPAATVQGALVKETPNAVVWRKPGAGIVQTPKRDVERIVLGKLTWDRRERDGLVFEVTPPEAADSYGGWWISLYVPAGLERSRASEAELREVTTSPSRSRADYVAELERAARESQGKGESLGSSSLGWSDDDFRRARGIPDREKTVYVRSYYRKDGTYVQAHTRSAPHHR